MLKRDKIVIITLLVFMIFNFFWYNAVIDKNSQEYHAVNGKMDMSGWVSDQSIVALKGEWFYFDQVLRNELGVSSSYKIASIPENKKDQTTKDFHRFGTYRLAVTGLEPSKAYGLYVRDQVTAYNLYIDGQLMLNNGVVAKNIKDYTPQWSEQSSVVLTDELGAFIIEMEISNFLYEDGLFWNSIKIGEPEAIFSYHANQLIAELLMIAGFLAIAILFMMLFLLFDLELSLFYFSIFTFVVCVRLMFASSRPIVHFMPNIPWSIVVRMEYLAGYLLAPIILLYMAALIKSKYLKPIEWIGGIYSAIIIVITLFGSHSFYSQLLNGYLYMSSVLILGSIITIIIFYKRSKINEIILLMSFVNFFAAMLKQIFGNQTSWLPIAIFNAVCGLSIIMLNHFWRYIKEKELQAINAAIDPLTGLYNRHYLNEYGKNRFRESVLQNECYVMFLDVDEFKQINDQFGHKVGDTVLQIVGQRVRQCLREKDMIFRYGGDEFVIIAYSENVEQVMHIGTRLIESLNDPIYYNDIKINIGASIGVTRCSRGNGMMLDSCIHLSDKAMYEAKQSGGNCMRMVQA